MDLGLASTTYETPSSEAYDGGLTDDAAEPGLEPEPEPDPDPDLDLDLLDPDADLDPESELESAEDECSFLCQKNRFGSILTLSRQTP